MVAAGLQREAGEMAGVYLPMYVLSVVTMAVVIVVAVTLIDTLAWGSLGHVLGYIALASFSAQSAGIPITPAN